jgi:hypothetical protein
MNNKLTQINVKNVSAETLDKVTKRFPVSPSLIIRALLTYATSMSDDEFLKMVNHQAAIENKDKGL